MKITPALTDDNLLAELGKRLTHQRLNRELTQAELAAAAGVSKRTLERIEAGASSQLSSWLRCLRALDLLDGLEQLLPEASSSPMALLKQQQQQTTKQRASRKRRRRVAEVEWSWGDDA